MCFKQTENEVNVPDGFVSGSPQGRELDDPACFLRRFAAGSHRHQSPPRCSTSEAENKSSQ